MMGYLIHSINIYWTVTTYQTPCWVLGILGENGRQLKTMKKSDGCWYKLTSKIQREEQQVIIKYVSSDSVSRKQNPCLCTLPHTHPHINMQRKNLEGEIRKLLIVVTSEHWKKGYKIYLSLDTLLYYLILFICYCVPVLLYTRSTHSQSSWLYSQKCPESNHFSRHPLWTCWSQPPLHCPGYCKGSSLARLPVPALD